MLSYLICRCDIKYESVKDLTLIRLLNANDAYKIVLLVYEIFQ